MAQGEWQSTTRLIDEAPGKMAGFRLNGLLTAQEPAIPREAGRISKT